MQSWEYLFVLINSNKVVVVNGKYLESQPDVYTFLNEQGKVGWEVVGIAGAESLVNFQMILKRPTP